MNENNVEMLKKLIESELGGKYAAIHTYGKLIWIVRTGYLVLLFTAWITFLTVSVSQSNISDKTVQHVLPLFLVSLMVAIAGFVIDRNYVVHKFRVIDSVNKLLELLVRHGDECIRDDSIREEKLEPLLQVSGDSGAFDHKSSNQYANEIFLTYFTYSGSCVIVLIAAILLARSL